MTLLGNTRLVVACVVLSIVLISHHAAADEYCEETSHDSASAWRQCALGEEEAADDREGDMLAKKATKPTVLSARGQVRQSMAKFVKSSESFCKATTKAKNSRRKERRRLVLQGGGKGVPKCVMIRRSDYYYTPKTVDDSRRRRRRSFLKFTREQIRMFTSKERKMHCAPLDKFGCTPGQRKLNGCKTCTGPEVDTQSLYVALVPRDPHEGCTSCQDEYGFLLAGSGYGDNRGEHYGQCDKMLAEKKPVTCKSMCKTQRPGGGSERGWIKGESAQPTAPDFVCSRYCMIRTNILDMENKRGKVLHHKRPLGEPGADSDFFVFPHSELSRRQHGRFESRVSLVTCRLRKIVDCVTVAKSKRKCQVQKSSFCHAIQGYGNTEYTGMPNVPFVHAPTRAEKDMCKTFPDACAFTTVMN